MKFDFREKLQLILQGLSVATLIFSVVAWLWFLPVAGLLYFLGYLR